MRGVLIDIPASLIAKRQRLGLDRYDEMWEGVYHMPPDPSVDHQSLVTMLTRALFDEAVAAGLVVTAGLNLCHPGQSDRDYRIPDAAVIDRDLRFDVKDGFGVSGGVHLAIEVRSPKDESYEKVGFYAERGVQCLVIIDGPAGVMVRYDLGEDGAYEETRSAGPLDIGFGVSVTLEPGGHAVVASPGGTWRA